MEIMDFGTLETLYKRAHSNPDPERRLVPEPVLAMIAFSVSPQPSPTFPKPSPLSFTSSSHLQTISGLRDVKEQTGFMHRGMSLPLFLSSPPALQQYIPQIDVKPTNIMVNTSGEIKICDFNIAGKLVNSFARSIVGTKNYMAVRPFPPFNKEVLVASHTHAPPPPQPQPERMDMEAPGYDVRSDIWSLGITLVEVGHGGGRTLPSFPPQPIETNHPPLL